MRRYFYYVNNCHSKLLSIYPDIIVKIISIISRCDDSRERTQSNWVHEWERVGGMGIVYITSNTILSIVSPPSQTFKHLPPAANRWQVIYYITRAFYIPIYGTKTFSCSLVSYTSHIHLKAGFYLGFRHLH